MKRRPAFTLIELLLVLAILGTLLAISLSGIHKVRDAANRTACANNLKQLGLACHSYHDAAQVFPPGYKASPGVDPLAVQPGWGWAAHLLPYLEQTALRQQIDMCRPVEDPANAAARLTTVPAFRCLADSGQSQAFTIVSATGQAITQAAPSSYAASCGAAELDSIPGPMEGVFYRNSRIGIADIIDGTSTTCLIGDRASSWSLGPWAGVVQSAVLLGGPRNPARQNPDATEPAPYLCLAQTREINDWTDRDGALDDFHSEHPGGINMLFADGAVLFLQQSMDPIIFAALGTRAGGEVVGDVDVFSGGKSSGHVSFRD
jgi:prepilin-type N-terminal cleavage/methylation domain-containing protein/prepilin-type processing-associated H-X9-DG protein